MPALTSYSPYEKLLFFQNVAHHGSDIVSLQAISTSLNQNELIRESNDYDASKFSPDALQHLYQVTINGHKDNASNGINGDLTPNGTPVKRKVSASPPSASKAGSEQFIQQFVDSLYTKFKEETIRELRKQEDEHRRLQDELRQLENNTASQQPDESTKSDQRRLDLNTTTNPPSSLVDNTDPVAAQLHATLEAANASVPAQPSVEQPAQAPAVPVSVDSQPPSLANVPGTATSRPGSASASASASNTPQLHRSQPAPLVVHGQHHSPGAYHRTLPPPSPQRSNYGPAPPAASHGYPHQQLPQGQPPMLPSIHNLQRMPSHEAYPPQRAASQGRGSPIPQQHPQQPYPQYPPYQSPHPQHGWQSPNLLQYPQQQYYPHPVPQPPRRPQVHTPNQPQPPYQPYPHTAPVPYAGQQQWHGPALPPHHYYPASASTTPIPRSRSRMSMLQSGNSTPWKGRSTPTGMRARSPSRLEREVSPLSDHGSPSPASPKRNRKSPKPDKLLVPAVNSRDKSTTPTNTVRRSQSVISTTSETAEQPKRRVGRPPKVKAEPPSTPAQTTSDSEHQQRSSGRRGRPRGNTTVKPEASKPQTNNKRKRDTSTSPVPRARSTSNIQPVSSQRGESQHEDLNLVMVSKTFGRTSQLLMDEVAAHKVAGVFAKPLTERDAPGYKSTVYRPQDLKSIKAAITKGSRTAIAAIEEAETSAAEEGTDTEAAATPNRTTPGPIGNGFYLVSATDDLRPPKGIVNFVQLEMELVRMFANAVMFNPLPSSERGFGRSLRLRKHGGELLAYGASRRYPDQHDEDEPSTTERDVSEPATVAASTDESESSSGSALDDGGIITDARGMFKDVEELVARWRKLEGEKMGGAMQQQQQQSGFGNERQPSVSASSAVGEDANDGEATPTASLLGSVRKRRRVGDH